MPSFPTDSTEPVVYRKEVIAKCAEISGLSSWKWGTQRLRAKGSSILWDLPLLLQLWANLHLGGWGSSKKNKAQTMRWLRDSIRLSQGCDTSHPHLPQKHHQTHYTLPTIKKDRLKKFLLIWGGKIFSEPSWKNSVPGQSLSSGWCGSCWAQDSHSIFPLSSPVQSRTPPNGGIVFCIAVQLHQLLLVSKAIWIFRHGLRHHIVKHSKKLWPEKVLPKIKCCLHPPLTQTLSAESHSLLNPDTGWSRVSVPAV